MSRRKAPVDVDGVVVVDKPEGPTSFDIVRQLKRALSTPRVGHTGTLDPMASGVLVVCAGWSTRLVPYLADGTKTYEGTMRLGVATNTDDAEGVVTAERDASATSRAQMVDALKRLTGEIMQRPPAYSAIKLDGKRAYDLARAGQDVEIAPRAATVHVFELLGDAADRGDVWRFRAEVSHGTYIRSLARDVGELLGVGAHLTALRRTANAPFTLADALRLGDIHRGRLVDPWRALAHLPAARLDAAGEAAWGVGRRVPVGAMGADGAATLDTHVEEGAQLRVCARGEAVLLGVGVLREGAVVPQRVRPGVWGLEPQPAAQATLAGSMGADDP